VGSDPDAGQKWKPALLSKCPKNLHVLWAEYESGIGGNKPARLFAQADRGKVKYKYCQRKIVWDAIENMRTRGVSAAAAIERIYTECDGPTTPVHAVINKLREWRRAGEGNPRLCIDPPDVRFRDDRRMGCETCIKQEATDGI
jgi:hypothetical protein